MPTQAALAKALYFDEVYLSLAQIAQQQGQSGQGRLQIAQAMEL